MKQTEVRFNLDGLEEIKEKVGRTYRTRVGIIGGKAGQNHPGGITNAVLGLIQMFGSIIRNVTIEEAREAKVFPASVA